MTASRLEYSRYLNRVTFENGVLRVEGRRFLVTLMLFVFLAILLGLLFAKVPFFVKGCVGITIPILLWGFVDVFSSKSELTFEVEKQTVSVLRRSLKHETKYDGPANRLVSVTKRRQPTTDSVADYEILFVFDNGSVRVPLILECCSGEEDATRKVAEWEERLHLVDALS